MNNYICAFVLGVKDTSKKSSIKKIQALAFIKGCCTSYVGTYYKPKVLANLYGNCAKSFIRWKLVNTSAMIGVCATHPYENIIFIDNIRWNRSIQIHKRRNR